MNKPVEFSVHHTPQVGVERAHESAHLHVAGEATYTDDILELEGTLHAAPVSYTHLDVYKRQA